MIAMMGAMRTPADAALAKSAARRNPRLRVFQLLSGFESLASVGSSMTAVGEVELVATAAAAAADNASPGVAPSMLFFIVVTNRGDEEKGVEECTKTEPRMSCQAWRI